MTYAQGTLTAIPRGTVTPGLKQPWLDSSIRLGQARPSTDTQTKPDVSLGMKLAGMALVIPEISTADPTTNTLAAAVGPPLTSMTDRPELWTFLLSNLIVFSFGTLMTVLSYLVYRRRGRASTFRTATLGFGLITIGGLVEPVYELTIAADKGEQLLHTEILTVQSIEAILFAIGFGLLFYSVWSHGGRQSDTAETLSPDSRSK